MKYQGIEWAALEIAYDNGLINRYSPKEKVLKDLENIIIDYTADGSSVSEIDEFLKKLDSEDLFDLCCGETEEIKEIVKNAPENTDELLNYIFYAL